MAGRSTALLEEELTCPICHGFFLNPVSLRCNHNFCHGCLEKSWAQKTDKDCPVCRRRWSMERPPSFTNKTLQNIVEAYVGEQGSRERAGELGVCATHMRKLRLFCRECEEPVCTVCVEAAQHTKHTHQTVEEATKPCKVELSSMLKVLHDKLESLNQVKAVSDHTTLHIKSQAQSTEGQIKREFGQLHQFLREEEEASLAALRREEMQKTALLTERIAQLSSETAALSEKITDIGNRMETEDISFLQIFKDIKERAQCTEDPEPIQGVLIDVAKHLSNLKFRVWEKMQGRVQYTPVTLDVNSAHPDLLINGVLLEVRDGRESQPVPENAERFDSSVSVLGVEGFSSGTHSWEVEVGCKSAWTLGVARESIPRKGGVTVSPEGGLWVVGMNGAEYSAGTAPLGTTLTLKRKPERVRVQLDCDKGQVSFYDSADMSLMYTFKEKFRERLFPYFSPCLNTDGTNPGALRICPERVSVTVAP